MLSPLARFAAPCAALALSACAGGDGALRREVAALRTDVDALRAENLGLARRLDSVAARLERADEKALRPAAQAAAVARPPEPSAPLVPPDLAVVRMAPRRAEPEREIVLRDPARAPRAAPRLPTAVPVAEPDPERLDDLSRPAGRDLSAEAEAELAAARRKGGLERAHALEAFVVRYPHHPSADNALVEAARQYGELGRDDAGCELARRVPREYPAGDAVAGALEIVARCERSRP